VASEERLGFIELVTSIELVALGFFAVCDFAQRSAATYFSVVAARAVVAAQPALQILFTQLELKLFSFL
jgi:hypothetical protein